MATQTWLVGKKETLFDTCCQIGVMLYIRILPFTTKLILSLQDNKHYLSVTLREWVLCVQVHLNVLCVCPSANEINSVFGENSFIRYRIIL